MNRIISSSYNKSAAKNDQCPSDKPAFVMIGRSNVGKSTLINAICNRQQLALTSSKPGKTSLINYFNITSIDDEQIKKEWYLVDLPGYGYAKVSKTKGQEWGKMITNYLLHQVNCAHIFILIDSRIPPQEIDLAFIQWIHEHRRPFSLVFTKIDKNSQKETNHNLKQFMLTLSQTISHTPPYYMTSGIKPQTTQAILDIIHTML